MLSCEHKVQGDAVLTVLGLYGSVGCMAGR